MSLALANVSLMASMQGTHREIRTRTAPARDGILSPPPAGWRTRAACTIINKLRARDGNGYSPLASG